jgi:macrolide transport system ATP-binding/permease protein
MSRRPTHHWHGPSRRWTTGPACRCRGARSSRWPAGWRSRLHLALRLAERPEVLLLDEPGDHLSAALVDELIEALLGTAASVVVTTHDRRVLADPGAWPRLEL